VKDPRRLLPDYTPAPPARSILSRRAGGSPPAKSRAPDLADPPAAENPEADDWMSPSASAQGKFSRGENLVAVPGKVYPELAEGNPGFQSALPACEMLSGSGTGNLADPPAAENPEADDWMSPSASAQGKFSRGENLVAVPGIELEPLGGRERSLPAAGRREPAGEIPSPEASGRGTP